MWGICVCGRKGTTLWHYFPPSTSMWSPGMEIRLPGLLVQQMPSLAEPLTDLWTPSIPKDKLESSDVLKMRKTITWLEAIFERESAVWSNLWSFSIWAWGRPCCLLPSPCTETAGRHLSSRKARWPINAKDYHHQNTSHLNWVCLAAVSGFHEVV